MLVRDIPLVSGKALTGNNIERFPLDGYFDSLWRQCDARPPRVVVFPKKAERRHGLSQVFDIVEVGEIDAVLLADAHQVDELENFQNASGLSLVPVINATGTPTPASDVGFDINDPQDYINTVNIIKRFANRRAKLSDKFLNAESPAARMLAFIFVSGEDFIPIRRPHSRYFVEYKRFSDAAAAITIAEALAKRGWLERRFFARHHECDSCRSHRLVVREECPACRSANLAEADLIHHYSCAQLGPETAFHRGSALICPKCSKQLRNYGKDYDKPGTIQICCECSQATSEPAIGFECQDCGSKRDGEHIRRVDIYSYSLSDYAQTRLTRDRAQWTPPAPSQLNVCPVELQQELQEITRHASGACGCIVVELTFEAQAEVRGRRGKATLQALRKLFLENLQGHLAGRASVHTMDERQYILFFDLAHANSVSEVQPILDACDAVLSDRLQACIHVLWHGRADGVSG